MAHSIQRLTLDFSSGRGLKVREFKLHVGLCSDRTEPGWESLSVSILLAFWHALSLSQK